MAINVGRSEHGLVLVEMLIAMALGISLLAGFTGALAQINSVATGAIVQAEVTGKLRFTSVLLADQLASAHRKRQLPGNRDAFDPCLNPVDQASPDFGVAVFSVAALPDCLVLGSLATPYSVVVIQVLEPCQDVCVFESAGAFVWYQLGCHPLFITTEASVVIESNPKQLNQCATSSSRAVLKRYVYYVRTYAWVVGDGIPSLMRKELRPENGVSWQQAEMVVEGVELFQIDLQVNFSSLDLLLEPEPQPTPVLNADSSESAASDLDGSVLGPSAETQRVGSQSQVTAEINLVLRDTSRVRSLEPFSWRQLDRQFSSSSNVTAGIQRFVAVGSLATGLAPSPSDEAVE